MNFAASMESKTGHPPSSRAKVKNECSCTSTPTSALIVRKGAVKVKITPEQAMAPRREVPRCQIGVGGQHHALSPRFTPGKRPRTYCTGA